MQFSIADLAQFALRYLKLTRVSYIRTHFKYARRGQQRAHISNFANQRRRYEGRQPAPRGCRAVCMPHCALLSERRNLTERMKVESPQEHFGGGQADRRVRL